ncbi:MAG: DnaA regulatory inactivator Hda [Oxalobacteraceae bacterium]|nr:DnaA regulatory inactivator Hda [Oxalobacteraceae bacterium]
MKQLLLDWGATRPQTLENFVAGRNQELASVLRQISQTAAADRTAQQVLIWGEAGAGKSHLLRALAMHTAAILLTPSSPPKSLQWSADYLLYLIDDGVLVATAKQAPLQLDLREDLRTRLGWGLVYQVHGLSDEEKIDALSQSAAARGLSLSAGVVPYLLTHFRRDMQSLSTMLDALDRYSLETQRPITLPLLRELLQTSDYTTQP